MTSFNFRIISIIWGGATHFSGEQRLLRFKESALHLSPQDIEKIQKRQIPQRVDGENMKLTLPT
ncbi:MAG: hypothetical protein ACOYYS_23335 [Chloroflexota bacterium]